MCSVEISKAEGHKKGAPLGSEQIHAEAGKVAAQVTGIGTRDEWAEVEGGGEGYC